MKKFIVLYKGPATPMEEMSEEQRDEVNRGWADWMGKYKEAIVEMGAPMDEGRALSDDGNATPASQITGYSILQAEDMNGLMEIIKDHPFLSEKKGRFFIEAYELLPIPEM